MKYFRYSLLLLLTLVFSCSVEESTPPDSFEDDVFYATVEHPSSIETKVYADENLSILWNEDDRISIFNRSTANQEYCFTGSTGENAGTFSRVASNSSPSGSSLSKVYAVYPYQEGTSIDNNGTISFNLPSEQIYHENSFGIGANTMVSASEDNYLRFKNIGGYLVFKLYGEDVSVSSISLKGNKHEKIAGGCTIGWSNGIPVTTMSANATEEITLTCDDPVALGSTSTDYVEFWLVVPPVTFTEGFTITVSTSDGGVFEKSTSKEISIDRSTIQRMAPIEVSPLYDVIVFADRNFKAYMVENFDKDFDGEISFEEALLITCIGVDTDNIASVHGIEYCLNLQALYCGGSSNHYDSTLGLYVGSGLLSSLDVSNNIALTALLCTSNQLTGLDLSNNTSLTSLSCDGNQLTSLDVSENTALISLNCDSNQLTSLDLSNNTALTDLDCGSNQLTGLDLSNNTALTWLNCYFNQLTSLDVSNNTALEVLYCKLNYLASLDVSNNTALTTLDCSYNQLASLDVSNNIALTDLDCGSNQLTSLDVSNNTALSSLGCDDNQLTSLDVSNNNALTTLCCGYNQLTGLNLSNNPALEVLFCELNYLASLDVSNNTSLTALLCTSNQLTGLDLSNNTALTDLDCSSNQLTSLDLSNNAALTFLDCSPMNDIQGHNLLGALYIASWQSIPNVTINRNNNYIPAETQIIVKPEAVDLGLTSGLKWASFNLGASAPEEYGDYYAWGETETKSSYDWSNYLWSNGSGNRNELTKYCPADKTDYWDGEGTPDGKTSLDLEDDAAWANLGGTWRMPTDADWTELRTECTWTWTTQNEVNGYLVTGTNGNSIFLPAAGERLYNAGFGGCYWSSLLSVDEPALAWGVYFNSGIPSGSVRMHELTRFGGGSVRPVTE